MSQQDVLCRGEGAVRAVGIAGDDRVACAVDERLDVVSDVPFVSRCDRRRTLVGRQYEL